MKEETIINNEAENQGEDNLTAKPKRRKGLSSVMGMAGVAGAALGVLTPLQVFPQSTDFEGDGALDADDQGPTAFDDDVEIEDNAIVDDDDLEELADQNNDNLRDSADVDTTEETEELVDDDVEVEENIVTEEVEEEVPEETANYLEVAHNVNDSMSFNQAFAEARREVGEGGLFQWHGNTYSTYYAEEWESMSADDKAEYWKSVTATTEHINDENEEESGEFAEQVEDIDVIPDEVIAEEDEEDVVDVEDEAVEIEDEDEVILEDENEISEVEASVEDQEEIVLDNNDDDVIDEVVVEDNEEAEIEVAEPEVMAEPEVVEEEQMEIEDIEAPIDVEVQDLDMQEAEDFVNNPDIDVSSNIEIDPNIPIDNNMDMHEFV